MGSCKESKIDGYNDYVAFKLMRDTEPKDVLNELINLHLLY